jgi:hypothetical protein
MEYRVRFWDSHDPALEDLEVILNRCAADGWMLDHVIRHDASSLRLIFRRDTVTGTATGNPTDGTVSEGRG